MSKLVGIGAKGAVTSGEDFAEKNKALANEIEALKAENENLNKKAEGLNEKNKALANEIKNLKKQ